MLLGFNPESPSNWMTYVLSFQKIGWSHLFLSGLVKWGFLEEQIIFKKTCETKARYFSEVNASSRLWDQEEMNDWYLIIKTVCSARGCYLLLHSLSIFASLIILSEQTPLPSACPAISGIHQPSPVSSYGLLRQSLCYKHFTGCWEPPLGWLQSFLWGVRLSLLCLPFKKCVVLVVSSQTN